MALFGNNSNKSGEMSFLGHLEVLRWHLVRSAAVIFTIAVTLFCFPEFLFDTIIFAPKHPEFWTYRMLCQLDEALGAGGMLCITEIPFELINTELSAQFTTHMWISFVGGLICGLPYLLWELWRFIKPALRQKELGYAKGIVFFTSMLFLIGVLFGYYVIVPLSVNFLGTYQVSVEVKNTIQMSSFISTVTTITLAAGIVFELPIVVYFLSKIGIMTPTFMRKFRKHAVVVILIVSAVITPSPDITSQLLVAFPLYFLYEISIFVSAYVIRNKPVE
ncbi:MAG: twin-arginine translocase subunit TatC [Bacteroidota bacterium]